MQEDDAARQFFKPQDGEPLQCLHSEAPEALHDNQQEDGTCETQAQTMFHSCTHKEIGMYHSAAQSDSSAYAMTHMCNLSCDSRHAAPEGLQVSIA